MRGCALNSLSTALTSRFVNRKFLQQFPDRLPTPRLRSRLPTEAVVFVQVAPETQRLKVSPVVHPPPMVPMVDVACRCTAPLAPPPRFI